MQAITHLRIAVNSSKLECDVPSEWSVMRLKCFLCTLVPVLKLYHFHCYCNHALLVPNIIVSQLQSNEIVVRSTREQSNEFSLYYEASMKQLLAHTFHYKQLYVPVLSPEFSDTICKTFKMKQADQNIEEEEHLFFGQMFKLLIYGMIARMFLPLFMGLIDHLDFGDVTFLLVIGLIYLLIERQVWRARNINEMNQNDIHQPLAEERQREPADEEQRIEEKIQHAHPSQSKEQQDNPMKEEMNKQRNVVKRKIYEWTAWLIESVYCFIFSLFPNWRVEIHLEVHALYMKEVQKRIADL